MPNSVEMKDQTCVHRWALIFLATASPLILLAFFFGGPIAETIFVLLVMAFPVALILVAVGRKGPIGWLGFSLFTLLLILEGSGLGMMLLRGQVRDGTWIGGLPAAAAIQLYCLWLGPLLLVALTHALTFDRFGIREEDLKNLDEVRRSGEDGGS